MGKRGPQKTPTAKLKARGSKLVSGREGEVIPDVFNSNCPDWLGGEGKAKWFSLVAQLSNLGIIGDIDFGILAQYCHWWDRFLWLVKDCPQDIHTQSKASSCLMHLGAKLGLSPSDRIGLKAQKTDNDNNSTKRNYFKVG